MTNFTQKFAAACAAIFIVTASLAPVIAVPPAHAATIAIMPILA